MMEEQPATVSACEALLEAIEEFEPALFAWGEQSRFPAVRGASAGVDHALDDLRGAIESAQTVAS